MPTKKTIKLDPMEWRDAMKDVLPKAKAPAKDTGPAKTAAGLVKKAGKAVKKATKAR